MSQNIIHIILPIDKYTHNNLKKEKLEKKSLLLIAKITILLLLRKHNTMKIS